MSKTAVLMYHPGVEQPVKVQQGSVATMESRGWSKNKPKKQSVAKTENSN